MQTDELPPVRVPRSAKRLVAVAPDRVRRFRKHLVKAMREAREVRQIAPVRAPVLSGVAARVAGIACGLCQGWCCRHGGDDAYLDGDTMARVRAAMPERDARAVARLYVERVPEAVFEESCIFHGVEGCTLDRSMRADICNSYFCGGLATYLKAAGAAGPVVVIAGEGDDARSASVLVPPG